MEDSGEQVSPPQVSEGQDNSNNEASTVSNVPSIFQDQDADIIIRTSDEVDFRVYKVILGVASPVFKTMFPPQPVKSEGKADKVYPVPVMSISESSAAFDLLLQLCYPVEPPQLDDSDVSLIGEVLAAALKYEIKAVIAIAKKALRARAEKSYEDAIAAYSISCRMKQEDIARSTARTFLKWPFPGPKVPQLAKMSASDYHALMVFHKDACARIISAFRAKKYKFTTETCAGVIPEDHACSGRKTWSYPTLNSQLYLPIWWVSSMDKLADALHDAPFDTTKLSLSTLAPQLLETDCRKCRGKALNGWEETREKIIAYMTERLDEVELELSWV